jgi:hypothetical protein
VGADGELVIWESCRGDRRRNVQLWCEDLRGISNEYGGFVEHFYLVLADRAIFDKHLTSKVIIPYLPLPARLERLLPLAVFVPSMR